jgi:Fic-DOC domain mobile mystery protein B
MTRRDPRGDLEGLGLFAVGAQAPGATPIDPDEAADLIPDSVRTLAQLDAFEQTNILAAIDWALRPSRRPTPAKVLTSEFLIGLHRRMFDRTWRWAGTLRRTDKNIGVHWPTIRVSLKERLHDVALWIAEETYDADEVAVRFHHALVVVHPFPNGNGRRSRLAADALLHAQRRVPLSWGAASRASAVSPRTAYLEALRAADRGNFESLMHFARS